MALPTIKNYPVKSTTLPVSRADIKYRPFLVQEQKILLMAKSSNELVDAFDAIEQVVQNCVVGGDEIDVSQIPIVDLEYLFLKIRCLSKGQISEIAYICKNVVEAEEDHKRTEEETKKLLKGKKFCGTRVKINLDLSSIEPVISDDHTNKIDITGTDFSMVFKYPTLDSIRKLIGKMDKQVIKKASLLDALGMEIVYDLLDFVHNSKDDSISRPDTHEEVVTFINNLMEDDLKRVKEKFVATLPRLETKINFVCPSCGHNEEIVLEGLQSFF